MTVFTRSIFAVELDGKPYGIRLTPDKMQQLLYAAAQMSDGESLDLYPMPNKDLFAVIMQNND